MRYENRQPVEGVNVTRESPVKQFVLLLIGALVLLLVLFFAFSFIGGWAARLIPASTEQRLVNSIGVDIGEVIGGDNSGAKSVERQRALNDLADRLIAQMKLPVEFDITVHYSDSDVFNAFATLGGHVVFFNGLIEQMPHENALAMVMAHEIAHQVHRDPISGLGAGVTAQLMLATVFGDMQGAGKLVGASSLVGQANFTRRMETRADRTAIAAVNDLYGHVNGADALFVLLAEQRGDDAGSGPGQDFFLTHPLDAKRIAAIERIAKDSGWLLEGEVTPLPEVFQSE